LVVAAPSRRVARPIVIPTRLGWGLVRWWWSPPWSGWRLLLTGLLWSPAVGIDPPIRHEPPSPLQYRTRGKAHEMP
jgi:hypothetical protein